MRKKFFILLLILVAGCKDQQQNVSPQDIARGIFAYLQMGSTRMQNELSPEDTVQLRKAAQLRPELHVTPADLMYLRIPAPSITGNDLKTETLFLDANTARVAVVNGKDRFIMEFSRMNGRWRLHLPIMEHP